MKNVDKILVYWNEFKLKKKLISVLLKFIMPASAVTCLLFFSFLILHSQVLAQGYYQYNSSSGYPQTSQTQSKVLDIGYPTVDKLETKLLGNVYAQENIYNRVNRLEQVVFGSVSKGDLSERVDKIYDQVYSSNYAAQSDSSQDVAIDSSYQGYRNLNNSNNRQYSVVLFDLENKILGNAYPSDSVDTRVNRLENKLFSSTMDSRPVSERIQRLTAYVDAQDSDSFYDDQADTQRYNKVMKGINAASVLFMILQMFL